MIYDWQWRKSCLKLLSSISMKESLFFFILTFKPLFMSEHLACVTTTKSGIASAKRNYNQAHTVSQNGSHMVKKQFITWRYKSFKVQFMWRESEIPFQKNIILLWSQNTATDKKLHRKNSLKNTTPKKLHWLFKPCKHLETLINYIQKWTIVTN